MRLVLASTSPYRRALLERLRVPFLVAFPDIDEAAFKTTGRSPRDVAIDLAQSKASILRDQYPDDAIIGGDQVATIDGEILDKPGSIEVATEQLRRLSGRSHQLLTAVCVYHNDEFHDVLDVTTLTMRTLSDDEIARYLAADNPINCAGSYKIESLGISLFESIDSADHTAIVGIPLMALTTLLRALGFSLP